MSCSKKLKKGKPCKKGQTCGRLNKIRDEDTPVDTPGGGSCIRQTTNLQHEMMPSGNHERSTDRRRNTVRYGNSSRSVRGSDGYGSWSWDSQGTSARLLQTVIRDDWNLDGIPTTLRTQTSSGEFEVEPEAKDVSSSEDGDEDSASDEEDDDDDSDSDQAVSHHKCRRHNDTGFNDVWITVLFRFLKFISKSKFLLTLRSVRAKISDFEW